MTLIPDNLFMSEFLELGARRLAKKYNMNVRSVNRRRRRLEERGNILPPPDQLTSAPQFKYAPRIPEKLTVTIDNGIVVIGGDPHYWPGEASVMHRAFVHFLKRYRQEKSLRAVFLNGDILDLSAMSRFPRDDWAVRPTAKDEIETGVLRLSEIEEAAGGVHKFMPWGNHDARFDRFIASRAPELEGIKYTTLEDHFALWQICKGVDINAGNNLIYVTHAYRGGEGATLNNVRRAGCHIITNHHHSANVRAVTFHNDRTFYGVDTGCLADTHGPQFGYLNGNPRDWRSAFCVLTIRNSRLLLPELVLRHDDASVEFRGEIIRV